MTSLHEVGWIRLGNDRLQLAIDPQGAQLSMLRDARGEDLLWSGDPAWWSGRAPILFPIVGALRGGRYRWQGRDYALPRHGFARGRRFEVVHAVPDAAVFRLRADEATRAVYPFEFELDLDFRLRGATLTVTAIARNVGRDLMPASLGFHPAFLRDGHRLVFEQAEAAPVRRLDADGLLSAVPRATPVTGRELALADALFEEDVVIFDRLSSRSLSYRNDRGAEIEVGFPDAEYLGLWSKPGAPFVCIEPWRGVADPAGFEGDLHAKPGMHGLRPGDELRLTMCLTVRPPPAP